MQYYVISGAQLYGPASIDDLRKWQDEGRIVPQTQIKDENGQIYAASSILYFPPDPNAPPAGMPQSPYQSSNPSPPGGTTGTTTPYTPSSPFSNPISPQSSFTTRSPLSGKPFQPTGGYLGSNFPQVGGNGEFGWSIAFSLSGLLCCPVIGPIIGVALGYSAKAKGHPNAKFVIIFAWVMLVLTLVGLLFGSMLKG